MSEHLKNARFCLDQMAQMSEPWPSRQSYLEGALEHLITALESLQSPQMPSETPSSPATGAEAGTSDTSSILWRRSYPASRTGRLPASALEDIWAWLSSQNGLGPYQEVEIGVTLTSKASTPLAGSPSPLTAEQTREGSGRVGEDRGTYFVPAREPSTVPSSDKSGVKR